MYISYYYLLHLYFFVYAHLSLFASLDYNVNYACVYEFLTLYLKKVTMWIYQLNMNLCKSVVYECVSTFLVYVVINLRIF